MRDKHHILTLLREEYNRWEELLNSMSDAHITTPQLPSGLSVKDVIAHLHAWQQISIARLEAALHQREPALPEWVAALGDNWEDDTDRTNAVIYDLYRDQPWSQVQRDWSTGFLRLLEAGEATPEEDMLAVDKYSWLKGYALLDVFKGSYEHHHDDHLEPLLSWARQQ